MTVLEYAKKLGEAIAEDEIIKNLNASKKAYEENIETDESSYMPTLFLAMGEPLYFSLDDGLNKIHIQRKADIEIAEAIIEYRRKRGLM